MKLTRIWHNKSIARGSIATATLTLAVAGGMAGAAPAQAASASCSVSTVVSHRSTVARGSHGSCVVQAQKELRAAGMSLGPDGADGLFGSWTRAATLYYQRTRHLQVDGVIGPKTWAKLIADRTKVPSSGTHLSAATVYWSKRDGMAVDISKSDRKIRLLRNGKVVAGMTANVRFGGWNVDPKTHKMRDYGTPNVISRVDFKAKHFVSTYVKDAAMPNSLFFYGGIAVHYSGDFKQVGYNGGSHGCVNMDDFKISTKYFNTVPNGTIVVVH